MEVVYGPLHKDWIKKWFVLKNKRITIMKDKDSENFESRFPVSACFVQSQTNKGANCCCSCLMLTLIVVQHPWLAVRLPPPALLFVSLPLS